MADGSDIVQEAIDDLKESVKDYKSTVCPVWATSVHRVLAELERLRAQAPGWRGMESAPRRERILIYRPDAMKKVQEAWWAMPYEGATDDRCWWQTMTGVVLPEGVTAWQPLPSPPAEGD